MTKKIEEYHYLNQSGCYEVNGTDDKEEYERVKMALTFLQISNEVQDTIWRVISSILLIGDLKIVPAGKGNEASTIENFKGKK